MLSRLVTTLLLLGAVLTPRPSLAAPCFEYSNVLEWVSETEVPGYMYDVVADGEVAWIGGFSPTAVYSFDISDPANPVPLGSFVISQTVGSGIFRMHLEGDRLYVAAKAGGLVILDVSDPAAPTLTAQLSDAALGGYALGVVVQGSYAWVSCAASGPGLVAVDVSDPAAPFVVGSTGDATGGWAVAVSGNLAAAGLMSDSVVVYDVSDPSAPVPLGTWAANSDIRWLGFRGPHLFVTGGSLGVRVLDISDPAQPVPIGQSQPPPFETSEVAFDGDRGFVSTSRSRVVAYDLSNPAAPDTIGSFAQYRGSHGVALAGSHLLVASFADGLKIYRVLPHDGVHATRYDDVAFMYAVDAAVAGATALVAASAGGLRIYDVAPAQPALTTVLPAITETVGVAVEGTRAYVVDSTDGVTSRRLRILDVSDPWNPVLLATAHQGLMNGQMAIGSLAVRDGVVYWPAGPVGLQLIDASVPGDVGRIGTLPLPGLAKAVRIHGGIACVAALDQLVIVDVSDPRAPFVRSALPLAGSSELDVQGDIAYVSSSSDGLVLVDISDPDLPVVLSTVPGEPVGGDVAVVGGVAYRLGVASGVQAVDVSNSGMPVARGWQAFSSGRDVAASPDLVVVCRGYAGVKFLSPHCDFALTAVPGGRFVAARFRIAPNPAGASGTGIRFTADRTARYDIRIHDVTGRRVRHLEGEALAGGVTRTGWDARDDEGRPVAAGVYFLRLSVGGEPRGAERVVVTR